jgi:endonuclease III
MKRVSQRMGLTENDKPEALEQDLMKIVPKAKWTNSGHEYTLNRLNDMMSRFSMTASS